MRKLFRLAILTVTLTASNMPSFLVKPAQAASWCWCTDYVASRFGLPYDYPNANNWNDGYLQGNGFRQVPPQKGAVVVMEASYAPNQWNAGHVGIVENIVTVNGRTYLDVRGGNQVGKQFQDANCSNVTTIRFGTPIDGRNDVSFWSKIPSRSMMVSKAVGRALDAGGANGTETYLHPTPMANNSFHRWRFDRVGNIDEYMIVSDALGKPLDGGGANGNQVYMHPQIMPSNPFQRWKLQPANGGYMVINVATGKALDAGGVGKTYMHPTPMPYNNYHIWLLN